MSRKRKGERDVAEVLEDLTTSFDPKEEMIQSQELRRHGFKGILTRFKKVPKVLVTHRGEPESVMLPYWVYTLLIEHVNDLQDRLEEVGIAQELGRERFRLPIERDKYVGEDVLQRALDDLTHE